ncbi:MAG: hypothetical protein K6C40_13175 [Thermoguttaceae bacterium]|nr:hypothetical protein [Thermoguttaceae bacterium]
MLEKFKFALSKINILRYLRWWLYLPVELERTQKLLFDIEYCKLFENIVKDSTWLHKKNFTLASGAIDWATLYILYRLLNEVRPAKIVEFGMGQSTLLFSQYAAQNSEVLFQTFENDSFWYGSIKSQVGCQTNMSIHLLDLEERFFKGRKCLRYQGDMKEYVGSKNELIFVDGPIGSSHYSRIQILDLIPEGINTEKFAIIFHDGLRRGEYRTAELVKDALKKKKVPFETYSFKYLKSLNIICSPDYSIVKYYPIAIETYD